MTIGTANQSSLDLAVTVHSSLPLSLQLQLLASEHDKQDKTGGPQVAGVIQLCLAIEDNGVGFSQESFLSSMMLKPRCTPRDMPAAGQLNFYGELQLLHWSHADMPARSALCQV